MPQTYFYRAVMGISTIFALSALSACGSSEKSTTTTVDQSPAGTVTTSTSTTTSVSPNLDAGRQVESNPPADSFNQTVQMGDNQATVTEAGTGTTVEINDRNNPDSVHVNMPGVHVNGNKDDDRMDIKVPFVHIHKDGQGHTHIKAPFVRINTNDDDSK